MDPDDQNNQPVRDVVKKRQEMSEAWALCYSLWGWKGPWTRQWCWSLETASDSQWRARREAGLQSHSSMELNSPPTWISLETDSAQSFSLLLLWLSACADLTRKPQLSPPNFWLTDWKIINLCDVTKFIVTSYGSKRTLIQRLKLQTTVHEEDEVGRWDGVSKGSEATKFYNSFVCNC